jgi:hypothetical protein
VTFIVERPKSKTETANLPLPSRCVLPPPHDLKAPAILL